MDVGRTLRAEGRIMDIRNYREGDEEQLYEVFYSSIHENAKDFYTENQLDAWAPKEMDQIQ